MRVPMTSNGSNSRTRYGEVKILVYGRCDSYPSLSSVIFSS